MGQLTSPSTEGLCLLHFCEIFHLLPYPLCLPNQLCLPAREKVLLKMIRPAPCRSLNSLNDNVAFTPGAIRVAPVKSPVYTKVAPIEVIQVLVGATRWVALFWENI